MSETEQLVLKLVDLVLAFKKGEINREEYEHEKQQLTQGGAAQQEQKGLPPPEYGEDSSNTPDLHKEADEAIEQEWNYGRPLQRAGESDENFADRQTNGVRRGGKHLVVPPSPFRRRKT